MDASVPPTGVAGVGDSQVAAQNAAMTSTSPATATPALPSKSAWHASLPLETFKQQPSTNNVNGADAVPPPSTSNVTPGAPPGFQRARLRQTSGNATPDPSSAPSSAGSSTTVSPVTQQRGMPTAGSSGVASAAQTMNASLPPIAANNTRPSYDAAWKLQQLALQAHNRADAQAQHVHPAPVLSKSAVWTRPSPNFRARVLAKQADAAPLFPRFQQTPIGVGVAANVDNNSRGSSVFADEPVHFVDSPALRNASLAAAGHSPSNRSLSAVSDNDSVGTGFSPVLSSSSLSSVNTPLSTTRSVAPSSRSSLAPSFTSPSMVGPSPGMHNVRRLAEQFLSSLTDDSPATRPRHLGLQRQRLTHVYDDVPTTREQLVSNIKADEQKEKADTSAAAGDATTQSQSKAQSDAGESKSDSVSAEDKGESRSTTITVQSPTSPISPPSSPAEWQLLHNDILDFARQCEKDSTSQTKLRDELVQRMQWSIRCVWPTAHVDLVGSVAAGVCLPKSDLDFVIYFPPSSTAPPSYSYASTAATATSATAIADAATNSTANSNPSTNAAYTYAEPVASNTGNAIAATPATGAAADANGAAAASIPSTTAPPSTAGADSPQLSQHFAHAGMLIKLIGGRKKSKLLFRSTKIQVFKDINLIRLRDGCSGISMDLWFPVSTAMLHRSQNHVTLIKSMLTAFPSFYPLAITLKAFMSSNLLNSGYSGLGSYGVLIMLIRYLQHVRAQAAMKGVAEESNVGRLLAGFFHFYAKFDYVHTCVDVHNVKDDAFAKKPDKIIVRRVRRPAGSAQAGNELNNAADSAAQGEGAPPSQSRPRRRRNRKYSDSSEGDDDDRDDDGNDAGEEDGSDSGTESAAPGNAADRESASLRKKRNNAADRFTLLIIDPVDTSNQIICHHKALRNIIGAFIKALCIIEPNRQPPPLMLPAQPQGAGTTDDSAGEHRSSTQQDSNGDTNATTSKEASTSNAKDGAAGATGNGIASETLVVTGDDSPVLVQQSLQLLPAYPGLKVSALQTNASRFHRLLDTEAARAGPLTKPCPSSACMNPDGSSRTQCPVQNKVCFTCGYMFVTQHQHGASMQPTHQQHKQTSNAGHAANINTNTVGQSQQNINRGHMSAPNTVNRKSHSPQLSTYAHPAATSLAPHSHQHSNSRSYNASAASTPRRESPTIPLQISNSNIVTPQFTNMLMQQQQPPVTPQQQPQLQMPNAVNGGPVNSSPLNLMNQNMQMYYADSYTNTAAGAVPAADASQYQMMAANPYLQLMYAYSNAMTNPPADSAALQAMMLQLQLQQQQMNAINAAASLPNSAQYMYNGLYSPAAAANNAAMSQQMNSYMAAMPQQYVLNTSGFDCSPTYPTRSLSDSNSALAAMTNNLPPPSPPQRFRTTGGGRRGHSSRAMNHSQNQLLQQQQQQYMAYQMQQQAYPYQ